MSKYPLSMIKNIAGNGVEKIAPDAETEARLKSEGWAAMGVESPEPVKPKTAKPVEEKK